MARYTQAFKVSDLFGSKKTAGLLPTFRGNAGGGRKPTYSEIFTRCARVINGHLGGTLSGEEITVRNTAPRTVERTVTQLKPILEAMFDNAQEIRKAIAGGARLYTSLASVSQAVNFTTERQRLKLCHEIMDNFQYNPAFAGRFKIASNSAEPFAVRQAAWSKKVGLKEV
jgi:hypothetical protein